VNSTETPGGSGIPAGWYDDPSGAGLRWWDGEQWTEHVHTAESAAAAAGTTDGSGSGSREGKPPRDLVKLRERIRARGIKGVGIVLGAIVVVIVVIALLVSGGSDNSSSANPTQGGTPAGKTAKASATQAQIKAINKRLKNKNLSKKQQKTLEAKKKRLQNAKSGAKGNSADGAKKQGEAKKEVTPGEEGG
jgi:hypothetical protein